MKITEMCQVDGTTHSWKVVPYHTTFKTLGRTDDEVVLNDNVFVADDNFVQIRCQNCGEWRAADNQIPLVAPPAIDFERMSSVQNS